MFATCRGNCGANSDAAVAPSGFTSARYSPPALRLKFACNGDPATARFFPDAKTIKKLPGDRLSEGNRHFVRFPGESVRNQPSILTIFVLALKISIQSEQSPSSSRNPVVLLARNSLMMTESLPKTRKMEQAARQGKASARRRRHKGKIGFKRCRA